MEKAKFMLASALTVEEYEEARREVRRMGLNPAKIEHRSLMPVEFHGRDLTIYEPLAREVREYCRAKKISVRDFVLQLMSGPSERKVPASGDKTATVKKPQRAKPGNPSHPGPRPPARRKFTT
jgi:hypothetical protein